MREKSMELSGFEEIAALDLEPIKTKLMHGKSGEGWAPERVAAAEREYRRFLFLMKKHPDELVAPTTEVDDFWHQHILDTAKYADDCQKVFGYFLHHYPYLGLLGEADAARRLAAGSRMRVLYEQSFGLAEHDAAGAARPGTGYCAVARADLRTAYCAVTQADLQTAYCAVTAAQDVENKVAYCAVTRKETQTAYCAVTTAARSALTGTAYCAAADVKRECVRETALH
jgi:hypothetical protein